MKQSAAVTTALLLCLGVSAGAIAQERTEGYVYDAATGDPVRDAFGDCVLTPFWTPALAIEECHPELIPKPEPVPVAEPPPPPPPEPAPPPPEPAYERITLEAVTLFDFDSDQLRPEGRARLDELVADLRDFPRVGNVRIVGHTDSTGPAEYNQGLSERRAQAVADYLVGQGVSAGQLEVSGMGETDPIASNETPEGRQLNRRVEIDVPVERQVRQ
jgi:OmpA-OmpF porin, OOP family